MQEKTAKGAVNSATHTRIRDHDGILAAVSDHGKLSSNELEHLAALIEALRAGPPKLSQTALAKALDVSQAKISELEHLSRKTTRETQERIRVFAPQLYERLAERYLVGTARARRFELMEKTYPERGRMLDRFDGMFPEKDFDRIRQRLLTIHPPTGATWSEADWAKRFWHLVDALEKGTF